MSQQASDTSPHLDLDALADALADVAEQDDARHLAACPSCTSRLAELRAAESRVVATLAALPAPPVPADLAARLTAALAAEPPLAAPVRPAVVTALPAQRSRRRAWLPAVAAGALLVTAGGLGLSLLGGPGGLAGGNDSADTAASAQSGGAGGTVALVQSSSGTDYADPEAVSAVLPDVLAGTAPPDALSAARTEGQPAPAAAGVPGGESTQDSAGAPDPLARLRTPEGLEDCLAALLPPDEPDARPLALDYATYSGQPALAVVLPDPDPAQLSVFVVGAGCSRANDGLLYFVRVAKP